MKHSVLRTAGLFCMLAVAACSSSATEDGNASTSDLSSDANASTAFHNVRDSLQDEAVSGNSNATQIIQIDSRTTAANIADIVPPKNMSLANGRGATPKALEGVYWMRGNPLADYLLSFSNLHLTNANGTNYGYMSISAPGSFAFKRKVMAAGAADGDYGYLPPSCRVPKDDATMQRIANASSTYDPNTYTRAIADDFAAMKAHPGLAADPRADTFINDVQDGGQLPVDGLTLLDTAYNTHAFYEAKFNADFTESSVQVVFVGTAPGILRDIFPPIRVAVPEQFGAFSFAPHLDGDPDVLVRKTFIRGLSKTPNYYFLTRIIDANGRKLPHFAEFVQCAQDRSGGELLKVIPKP